MVVLEYPGGKEGGMTTKRYQDQVQSTSARVLPADVQREGQV